MLQNSSTSNPLPSSLHLKSSMPFEAIIVDVEGVITDTRQLHFESWKECIDEILLDEFEKGKNEEKQLKPLTATEYYQYFEGKNRLDGIREFIDERGIFLNKEQIESLAAKKNIAYRRHLLEHRPEINEESVEAVKKWKGQKIAMAAVSSSKNCTEMLLHTGIRDLFDVQIDGSMVDELGISGLGKEALYLEAAEQLGKRVDECVVIEDAPYGITAVRESGFKYVIGMSKGRQYIVNELYTLGADMVVSSLLDIGQDKPNAITGRDDLFRFMGNRTPVFFLDFDGTLSDIVQNPDAATLRPEMPVLLSDCAKMYKVAIISGRDRAVIEDKVNIPYIYHAGCHGFDISGPDDFHFEVEEARAIKPLINQVAKELQNDLADIKGLILEDKKFFTAIHYRKVQDDAQVAKALQLIKEKIAATEKLSFKEGKKVLEIGPAINWNKGKAVRKLCELFKMDSSLSVPIYIGDDTTDEDAFKELVGWGIGIKVSSEANVPTAADYILKDTAEVSEFLRLLVSRRPVVS
jgi:trehalose-phosphatase